MDHWESIEWDRYKRESCWQWIGVWWWLVGAQGLDYTVGSCKHMWCLPSRGVVVVGNHSVVYMVPKGCWMQLTSWRPQAESTGERSAEGERERKGEGRRNKPEATKMTYKKKKKICFYFSCAQKEKGKSQTELKRWGKAKSGCSSLEWIWPCTWHWSPTLHGLTSSLAWRASAELFMVGFVISSVIVIVWSLLPALQVCHRPGPSQGAHCGVCGVPQKPSFCQCQRGQISFLFLFPEGCFSLGTKGWVFSNSSANQTFLQENLYVHI